MSLSPITLTALMVFATPTVLAQQADTPEKPLAVTAYEECAARVFAYSDKVSDVFKECEAEMDAFTEHLDDDAKEKVKQRAKAETQRELRAYAKEKKEKQHGGD